MASGISIVGASPSGDRAGSSEIEVGEGSAIVDVVGVDVGRGVGVGVSAFE